MSALGFSSALGCVYVGAVISEQSSDKSIDKSKASFTALLNSSRWSWDKSRVSPRRENLKETLRIFVGLF